MYIQPNSTIKLLNGVPIDPNQTDTLYFENATEQYTYFNSKVVSTFPENTYQRVNKGSCRLGVSADTIYNVNYMMFQNKNHSEKWFYAFVNSIEYINENTTEITFTIDPIQTWLFQYVPNECFIERETTYTDKIGEHIEPEQLGLGEYVVNGDYTYIGSLFSDQCVIIVWVDPNADSYVSLYDGVMSASKLLAYECTTTGLQEVKAFIDSQASHPDSIINIYMCPKYLVGEIPSSHIISYGSSGTTVVETEEAISTNDTIDGYAPKNNKLFTYPYNFYHVDTPDGQTLNTRYEFFKDLKPCFTISGNVTTPVELVCMPSQYRNTRSSSELSLPQEYRPERLSIKGFPICNWSTDYYASWLAQNSVPLAVNTGRNLLTMGVGASVGSLGAVVSASSNIANTLTDFYIASIHANITNGSFSTGSNDFSTGRMHFEGSRMSITHQIAKRIDDYFTCFGYNVGVVKAPNIHQRSRFTYIKTIGCNIEGDLPSTDAKYIADCYDRGIRFWVDHDNVCSYSEKNEPLGDTPESEVTE